MDLVLYGARLSPFVRKVEVVLREKGLEFKLESVSMPFPDWFKEISPARRMPALRDRDISREGTESVKSRPSVASNLATCRKILKQPVDLGL